MHFYDFVLTVGCTTTNNNNKHGFVCVHVMWPIAEDNKWREKQELIFFRIAHRSQQGWFNQPLLYLSILNAPKTYKKIR